MQKEFIFKGIDYQEHLWEKATMLLNILKKHSSKPNRDQYTVKRDANRRLKLTLPSKIDKKQKLAAQVAAPEIAVNYKKEENVKDEIDKETRVTHLKKPNDQDSNKNPSEINYETPVEEPEFNEDE